MSQWNIEIDSRYSQKFCLLHSINVPGISAVMGRCLNKVSLCVMYIHSNIYVQFGMHTKVLYVRGECPIPHTYIHCTYMQCEVFPCVPYTINLCNM